MTVITAALPLSGLIGHYGYLAVAGLVVVEGFGIPTAGQPAIKAGAVYAGSRPLSVAVVAAVAFLAAVGGDSIGYLILAGNHITVILTATTRYQAYALTAAAVVFAGYALILGLHRRRSPAGPRNSPEPALAGTSPERSQS